MQKKNPSKRYGRKILKIVFYACCLMFFTSLFYIIYLKWFPPLTTTLMLKRAFDSGDANGGKGVLARWKRYDDISPNAKIAIIAEEDQAFATHHGFDIQAIEKALKHNDHSKRIHGGSTISQQVAKNIFLWNGRSWLRKGLEVYFTFMIEQVWGKKRILQMYLNVAEMGNGIFGVEAASEKYFRKDASEISRPEAALLASVLPNPVLYNAQHPSAYILRKQARVLRAMQKIGGNAYLDKVQ